MTVTCPKCKKTLNVPDSLIGKTVTCPACKAPVQVEEKLEIISEGPLAPPPTGGPPAPGAGQMAVTCPNCGMPLLPTMTVCNRCGTNRFTGSQDKAQAGYQASGFKKFMGRSGWIVSLLVFGAIAIGIYVAVTKSRRWAKEQLSGEKPDAGKQETAKPGAGKQATGKTGDGKQATVKPGDGKQTTGKTGAVTPPPADTVNREEEIAERFEEVFALLMDPLPESQKRGRRQLGLMGADAVPHVVERYSESEDPDVRLAMVQALVRLNFPATSAKLAEAIGDEDDGVREAAIKGLVFRGKAASDLVSKALGSDNSRVQSAAIRIAGKLGLSELAPSVMALLAESSPLVRWQAAKCLAGRLATEEAYPDLIKALDDKSLDVAVAAAKALAGKPKAMPLVVARLDKLADEGNPRDTIRTLCLLAVPILASRDIPAKTKLAVQVCSDRPLPKVVSEAKKLLATASPGVRLQAMTEARKARESKPPMPLVASVNLMDRDVRIRTSAIKYFSAFPSEEMPLPLVIGLGDDDVKIAMSAAREIDRLEDKPAVEALRTAVEGVEPLRISLAAGLLARKDDPAGAEILEKAATRELKVPPPVPAWAAYQLSLLGDRDLAKRFVAESELARSHEERAYYTAAAARLGDQGAREKLKPMLADRRMPAEVRVEIAQLLSEDDPEESRQALLDMLDDSQVAVAALAALADTGDPKVVRDIMKGMPSFTRDVADVAMSTILGFGRRAEDGVLTALSSDDRRMCMVALEVMARLAKQTSKTGVKAVVTAMMKHQKDTSIKRLASEALEAMTGRRGRSDWTWREWAKALGVRISEAAGSGEEAWGWIKLQRPVGWVRRGKLIMPKKEKKGPDMRPTGVKDRERGSSFRQGEGDGNPAIEVTIERDPPTGKSSERPSKRRYKDAAAMYKARVNERAYQTVAGQRVRAVNISFKRKPSLTITEGKTKIRAYTLVLTDKGAERTSYIVFIVYPTEDANYYAEVECSCDTASYAKLRKLFETGIPCSISIVTEKIE